MSVDLHPKTDRDVLAAVQWAVAEEHPVEIVGQGSKRALGRPSQVAHVLDMSGLSGVTLFEPEELVLSAKAGTPLSQLIELLEQNNQEFQFEPVDLGPLLGQEEGGHIGRHGVHQSCWLQTFEVWFGSRSYSGCEGRFRQG